MQSNLGRGGLLGVCALFLVSVPATAQPATTKSTTATGAATSTTQLEGALLAVNGNSLVIKMSNGDIRIVTAAVGRKALIDGKEVAARDLKPGTKLKATVTTTTTSVVDRTVTVGSGKVFFVAGNNVILTLPNGENRQYKVKDDYKFMVEGKPATVFDLRKGMRVSAEKIVEEPRTMVSTNTVVTGEAPAPVKTEVAAVAAPAPKPAPVAKPAPQPEPVSEPEPAAAQLPAKLPKTGSPLPLAGLAGALLTIGTAASMFVRRRG
jgi:LPXTG-motif cell wall-anchored protein